MSKQRRAPASRPTATHRQTAPQGTGPDGISLEAARAELEGASPQHGPATPLLDEADLTTATPSAHATTSTATQR